MRKIFSNHLKLEINGVNLKRLIKNFYKNKIDIYNFEQNSHKNLTIIIKKSQLKEAITLLKDYDYKITKTYGFQFLKTAFLTRLGIFIGLAFFLISLILNNNYLSKIYVYGNSQIETNEILNYLSNVGINQNSFYVGADLEKIERDLENTFEEISFISIFKKGTNILINIKEKLFVSDHYGDIIAQNDGQILEISLVQGTPKFKVGDSVKKGDVLIEGVVYSGGEIVKCQAIGNIKMKVWYSASTTFLNEEVEYRRTGKVVINSYYKIFNKQVPIKIHNIDFKHEKQCENSYLFNKNILPIIIYKEKFYEIEEILIKNEFSLEKDAIIDKTKNDALSLVPANVEVQNIDTQIVDTENGKIITCYVETIVSNN